MSHSTRVRGLKYYGTVDATYRGSVALYTSAWIEITYICPSRLTGGVALYTSAWIEMMITLVQYPADVSRTLHECVD